MAKPRVIPSDRRSEIIDAAVSCVIEAGFNGAGMDMIARRAGMSVGIIYRYFKNKEEIVSAIVIKEIESELALDQQEMDSLPLIQLMDKLIDNISIFIRHQHERRRSALRLEIYAEAARNKKVEDIVRRSHQRQSEKFQKTLRRTLIHHVSASELKARVEMIRIIGDGLLVHGLYGAEDGCSIDSLCKIIKPVLQVVFLGSDTENTTELP